MQNNDCREKRKERRQTQLTTAEPLQHDNRKNPQGDVNVTLEIALM